MANSDLDIQDVDVLMGLDPVETGNETFDPIYSFKALELELPKESDTLSTNQTHSTNLSLMPPDKVQEIVDKVGVSYLKQDVLIVDHDVTIKSTTPLYDYPNSRIRFIVAMSKDVPKFHLIFGLINTFGSAMTANIELCQTQDQLSTGKELYRSYTKPETPDTKTMTLDICVNSESYMEVFIDEKFFGKAKSPLYNCKYYPFIVSTGYTVEMMMSPFICESNPVQGMTDEN